MRLRHFVPALVIVLAACGKEPPRATPLQVLGPVTGDAVSRVIVDSARQEVVLYAGPFRIPSAESMPHTHPMAGMAAMPEMSGMKDHAAHAFSPLVRFEWPMDGWYRGFRAALVDAQGNDMPRHLMHHLVGVDFAHRQLLQGDLIRFVAAGVETPDVVLPRLIGVPMKTGQQLAIYAGWHNTGDKDYEGVYIRLAMPYVLANTALKPITVFPVQMDVANTPGHPNGYDLPPGHSTKAFEFEMPIKGRFLGIGGHMHDFGKEVRLEDVASGDVIARVPVVLDSAGHMVSVGHEYFPVIGLRMAAGHRYRVVGEYNTPGRDTLANGAMSIMAGLFVPSDPSQWPAARFSDPETAADLQSLPGGNNVTAPVIGAMARTNGGATGSGARPMPR